MLEEQEIKKEIKFLELSIKVSVLEKMLLDNSIINKEEYDKLCQELIAEIIHIFNEKAKQNANLS